MQLSPREIVQELDKYIIGQNKAKRAVAIALRNRYRRSKLSQELKDDITPKNIIMKGPTGVGKTEIARRLAKLVNAPFVKVEATKFTEVGYVGRDVESMVRDLVECSVRLVKDEQYKQVLQRATAIAEKKVYKIIYDNLLVEKNDLSDSEYKDKILSELKEGKLNGLIIEIEVLDKPKQLDIMAGVGAEINLGSIFGDIMGKKKKRKMSVKDAMQYIINEESDKLIDNDNVNQEAIKRAEENGIIFIDEIDKIASKTNKGGADVSREGVQRDILPIVEGSTVMTKYGPCKTDYILFIAAGAFHISKVEDLIPELQGRFPIMVELSSLSKEDFVNILTMPQNAITLQYRHLLLVDNIELVFTKDAIDEIAEIAVEMNLSSEDIGARRLHTIMENLLEDVSFNADGTEQKVVIDKQFVIDKLGSAISQRELKKFIL